MKKIVILIISGLVLMGIAVNYASISKEGDASYKTVNSPNFRDGKFRNIEEFKMMSDGNFLTMMNRWMFGKEKRNPEVELPVVKTDLEKFLLSDNEVLKAVWFGHSTVLINIDGRIIMTDPVYAQKLSIIGPSRFTKKMPVDINNLPDLDLVIISHNHYNHLDLKTIEQIKDRVKHFYVPLGVGGYLRKKGVPSDKITEMDWWDEIKDASGLTIAATPAQHFSSRGIGDSNETFWVSWVISGPNHKIYYSGDTGYFDSFKEIGAKYGPFDMTFLENGAYDKMWHKAHLLPEETVQAHLELMGDVLLPVHWSAYNLAFHDWDDPIKRIKSASDSLEIKLTTPKIGEIVDYHNNIPNSEWWSQTPISSK